MTTTPWPSAGNGALRDRLLDLLDGVESWDDLERRHVAEAREWITSGAPVYRTAKPDVPAMHLVSYFVVVDADQGRLLLVAHRKAGLLLPTGGHVEPMEDPWDAVRRECVEELGVEAVALNGFGERPLFVTVTTTRGTHNMNSRGVSGEDLSRLMGCSPRVGRMRVRPLDGTHVSQVGRLSLRKRHRDLGCGRAERPVTVGRARGIGPAVRGALAGWNL